MKIALSISGTPIELPSQINNINNFAGAGANIFSLLFRLLLLGAALSAFVFIFYGGFKWLISQGDKKKVEEARGTIINAMIGLFIVFLAFLVVNLIGGFFKVNLLNLPGS